MQQIFLKNNFKTEIRKDINGKKRMIKAYKCEDLTGVIYQIKNNRHLACTDADVVAPSFFATSITLTMSPQFTTESALITTAGLVLSPTRSCFLKEILGNQKLFSADQYKYPCFY